MGHLTGVLRPYLSLARKSTKEKLNMPKNPAINHGTLLKNKEVHFTVVEEGVRLSDLSFSEKRFEKNLYLYYKDRESMPCKITDDKQIFDAEWLHWKAMAFVQKVNNSILEGNG